METGSKSTSTDFKVQHPISHHLCAMDYPIHPTQTKPPEQETKTNNPLKYAFGRLLPTTPPDDETPKTTESNHSNSESTQSTGSGHTDPNRTAILDASIRLMANTMLRMERAELEDEMTMMILQTQSHIASFVSQNGYSRKRKSSTTEDHSSASGTNTK